MWSSQVEEKVRKKKIYVVHQEVANVDLEQLKVGGSWFPSFSEDQEQNIIKVNW